LNVRLQRNPDHYNVGDGNSRDGLGDICEKDLDLLEEHHLIESQGTLKATEFGEAMARYYIKFETMKIFLALGERAKLSGLVCIGQFQPPPC
jgi:ATP-dependent DNA helicase HFM1/MER3